MTMTVQSGSGDPVVAEEAISESKDALSKKIAHEVARRRTFGIISHPDAGKTTLTEKLLLFSGAIQAGRYGQGTQECTACDIRLDGNRETEGDFSRQFRLAV